MQATELEFRLRGIWIGLIFWFSFSIYWIDHRNLGAMIAIAISHRSQLDDEILTHLVFGFGALLAVIGASLRTWAASYLTKDVVHDSHLHSEALVADGPYRFTRNPLYLAVEGFTLAAALLASPTGAIVMIFCIFVFLYRLILREEAGLGNQPDSGFAEYAARVPRLIPTLRPRIEESTRRPDWKSGIQSELFMWAFALGLVVFAITLDFTLFMGTVGLGIVFLVFSGFRASRKGKQ